MENLSFLNMVFVQAILKCSVSFQFLTDLIAERTVEEEDAAADLI